MPEPPPPSMPPGPPPHHRFARPVSGVDRDGGFALGVVVKRSYRIGPTGVCEPAPEQVALVDEPIEHPESRELIVADTDVLLDKPETDVVICGHAWNHPGGRSWTAAVQVGRSPVRELLVSGDRRATLGASGRIVFSQPQHRDSVPLSYMFAYGGCDERAEREGGFELESIAAQIPADERELALAAASPWRYPRNRAGRGYLVEGHPESIEALLLPNLEDPRDVLTPARLLVHDPAHWPLQPLPASFDWLEHGAFPRLGWFGETPEWDPDDIGRHIDAFPEIRFGYGGRELFVMGTPITERFDRRALNGASLGMRFEYLGGNEPITLTNLHRSHPRWVVQLPGERPRLYVDDRSGGVTPLKARLYSVIIHPDESLVSLVWTGFSKARRVYLPAELEKMPFLVEW
jgi:hypothetical protein